FLLCVQFKLVSITKVPYNVIAPTRATFSTIKFPLTGMKGHDNGAVFVTRPKRTHVGARVQKLRRSKRNPRIKQENPSSQEPTIQEPTPPCTPRVRRTYSYRPAAALNKNITTAINQRSDKLESKYTGSVPCQSQGPETSNQCQEPGERGGPSAEIEFQIQQPTVNWDCVSYVVSDQKVQTSYEKPEMTPSEVDSDGNTIPGNRVQAYGKMVTKTVTMTVTTTIATTEILRPGEEGYEESLERQKRQREQGPEEKQKQERQYHESRKWANGDRTMHENFHFSHHRAAQPAPSTAM
ncbi:uncharacterized protein H6S33_011732, partial [Morchella sextelata]|uniref:uncharacterized protein n=1 Tax=Morchella sextelata TaxID=1174677 RepID=UPI001D04994B